MTAATENSFGNCNNCTNSFQQNSHKFERMGKKTTTSGTYTLGTAIMKARENIPAAKRKKNKHTKKDDELNEVRAFDEPEKNMFSITEQNSLDDFLMKAQLAGTEFTAERMNITMVDVCSNKLIGVLTPNEEEKIKEAQEKYKTFLTIPRRPTWTQEMTAEELQNLETECFLTWRRKLAELQEVEGVVLTPFERNIEIWRQLWRVLDRSDVVVQILDARNPLLFRNEDLEDYVRKLSSDKINVLLMNKADLLNEKQRQAWSDYFNERNIRVVFWSALETVSESVVDKMDKLEIEEENSSDESSGSDDEDGDTIKDEDEEGKSDEEVDSEPESDANEQKIEPSDEAPQAKLNSANLLTRDDLIMYLKNLKSLVKSSKNDVFTVGMVGYPNVGKSSTINKLMTTKKVAVSAQPGKTKHFQTLFLDDELMLCDCPGLVMPSFAMSKQQMIVSAILPVDQMREFNPSIGLLCSLIPKHVFERVYGIMLPKPGELEDPRRAPTPHELLTTYAFIRGFMSPKGIPDWSRAARVIVKDYISGKLRYNFAPPSVDQTAFNDYDEFLSNKKLKSESATKTEDLLTLEKRHLFENKIQPSDVDQLFFKRNAGALHVKTPRKTNSNDVDEAEFVKPPKKLNKRPKKQKLRRIYGHLDA